MNKSLEIKKIIKLRRNGDGVHMAEVDELIDSISYCTAYYQSRFDNITWKELTKGTCGALDKGGINKGLSIDIQLAKKIYIVINQVVKSNIRDLRQWLSNEFDSQFENGAITNITKDQFIDNRKESVIKLLGVRKQWRDVVIDRLQGGVQC